MQRCPLPPALLVTLALAAAPVAAQDIPVGVELVLAVDVSRSIDPSEQLIQRQGYAEAFRSDAVQNAIRDGVWGRVAVTYVEWAGSELQTVAIPWTLIDSAASATAFAAAIEGGSPGSASRTSITGGITFSAGLFDANGFAGVRRVIDVSGDGPNNQGGPVTEARDAASARGIIINGLPLMTNGSGDSASFGSWSTIANLDDYYADCVIGGPGAFAIPVTGWDGFADAVRRKLVLELAGSPAAQLIRVQARAQADCLIGEKMRQERERQWGSGD